MIFINLQSEIMKKPYQTLLKVCLDPVKDPWLDPKKIQIWSDLKSRIWIQIRTKYIWIRSTWYGTILKQTQNTAFAAKTIEVMLKLVEFVLRVA